MKPDVQVYFTDPDELLRAKLKEVQKVNYGFLFNKLLILTFHPICALY